MAIAALPITVTAHVGVYLDAGSLTQFGRTERATLSANHRTMSEYKDSFDRAIRMATNVCNGGCLQSRRDGIQWTEAYYEYKLADAQHDAILWLLVEKRILTRVPEKYREKRHNARIPFFRRKFRGKFGKLRSTAMVS